MFSFGHADRAQYGGVGVMIGPPNVEVRISPAARFAAHGALADRASEFANRLIDRWGLSSLPACEISIKSPRNHTGLGVGTQLGLATAAGLRRYLQLSDLPVVEFAAAVGRGGRSAVGTYGFQSGGLLVDGGKSADESLGKLMKRAEVPQEWRFLLVCPPGVEGLTGACESAAFEQLPAVPDSVTNELWSITNEKLLPSIAENNCTAFGEAVYQFGRIAGECFAAAQDGPFASAEIADLVASIRAFGVAGVGQSSWGPTVFAITANDAEAEQLAAWIRSKSTFAKYETMIAQPNNRGAIIAEINAKARIRS
jgi:beta-RFAP synthase